MTKLIRAQFGEADRVEAENELADLIASSMGVADMLGRRRLLLELDAKLGPQHGLQRAETVKPAHAPTCAESHVMGLAYSARRTYIDGRWEQRTRDWRKVLADHVLTVTVTDSGAWWSVYDKGSGRLVKQARGTSTQDAMSSADGFAQSLARPPLGVPSSRPSSKLPPNPTRPWGVAASESRAYGAAWTSSSDITGPVAEAIVGKHQLNAIRMLGKWRWTVRQIDAGYATVASGSAESLDAAKRAAESAAKTAPAAESLHSELRSNVRYAASWWARRAGICARDYARRGARHYAAADTEQPLIPAVTFEEAVADLAGRSARWGPRLTASAKKVSELYSREHSFALAKSTSLKVTERIQEMLAEALRTGKPMPKVVDAITKLGDWSKAYSVNVYRTNLTTAYSAGRFAQANDPDVKQAFPALRYVSVCDSDARPTHCAMDGAVAAVNDPAWGKWAPPAGFQCRCNTESISRDELRSLRLLNKDGSVKQYIPAKARGFIAAGAFPDRGFGMGRPDLRLHGVRAL